MEKQQQFLFARTLSVLLASTTLLLACVGGGGEDIDNAPLVGAVTVDAQGFNTVSVSLGSSGKGTVKWKVAAPNISFKVSCNTTGWVALGFNSVAQMNGADIVMGYYTSAGGGVVNDYYATGTVAPTPDADGSQLSATSVTELNGITEMQFTRPLDPQDTQDMALTPGASTTMLLACAGSGIDNTASKHVVKATFAVDL